jgi:nucleoid DNA-binding protein
MGLQLVKQTELVENIAESTGYSKGDVRHFMAALEEEVRAAISDCRKVKVAGVQIEPKLKKATKKRMGRNPATGEDVQIAAKPASVKITARVLASLGKDESVVPSVGKLKKKLG